MNISTLIAELPMVLGAVPKLVYLVPLLLVCSLVYGATRHELKEPIIENSIRTLIWLVCFVGILFGVFMFFRWLI